MANVCPNMYERAFEGWLREYRVDYVSMDEHQRAACGGTAVKTFDYLLESHGGATILAEVKGRRFAGTSLANLSGLECWVTTEDVEGLVAWEEVFGASHEGAFVFAYRIEGVDVDLDGRGVFVFAGSRYVFVAVRLADYRVHMKRRSPKWRTVNLPAEGFRRSAISIEQLLL